MGGGGGGRVSGVEGGGWAAARASARATRIGDSRRVVRRSSTYHRFWRGRWPGSARLVQLRKITRANLRSCPSARAPQRRPSSSCRCQVSQRCDGSALFSANKVVARGVGREQRGERSDKAARCAERFRGPTRYRSRAPQPSRSARERCARSAPARSRWRPPPPGPRRAPPPPPLRAPASPRSAPSRPTRWARRIAPR